jgi:hypothetical protein
MQTNLAYRITATISRLSCKSKDEKDLMEGIDSENRKEV